MLVSELVTELALHIHDTAAAEISAVQMLTFIASASRDARNAGWLIRLDDDESTVIAANDFDYAVPANFAYIYALYLEDTSTGGSVYVYEIPKHQWTIRYDGSTPGAVIYFNTLDSLINDRKIKIVGQKRPTIYTLATQTVDAGMESFLRERTKYFAFSFIASGRSELAQWRQQQALLSLQESSKMLSQHPAEFRVLPGARVVPNRE